MHLLLEKIPDLSYVALDPIKSTTASFSIVTRIMDLS
jgi:hypothetical protein